eukprot:1062795-Pelagomonas_calceolata.AAC.8
MMLALRCVLDIVPAPDKHQMRKWYGQEERQLPRDGGGEDKPSDSEQVGMRKNMHVDGFVRWMPKPAK